MRVDIDDPKYWVNRMIHSEFIASYFGQARNISIEIFQPFYQEDGSVRCPVSIEGSNRPPVITRGKTELEAVCCALKIIQMEFERLLKAGCLLTTVDGEPVELETTFGLLSGYKSQKNLYN